MKLLHPFELGIESHYTTITVFPAVSTTTSSAVACLLLVVVPMIVFILSTLTSLVAGIVAVLFQQKLDYTCNQSSSY